MAYWPFTRAQMISFAASLGLLLGSGTVGGGLAGLSTEAATSAAVDVLSSVASVCGGGGGEASWTPTDIATNESRGTLDDRDRRVDGWLPLCPLTNPLLQLVSPNSGWLR